MRLFWFLYRAIPRVAALERIHQATATATGIGLAMSDPAKARTLLASLMAAAFEGEG